MDVKKIVYSINVEDIQTVADDELERELTNDELKYVEDEIGDYINWYDAISLALSDLDSGKKKS